MYKLKNRVISGLMASFIAVFTSLCPVSSVQAFDISQRGIAFIVTAKSVLTAALAAGGTIAAGAYAIDQSQLTPEEKIRIRNKIGALEDAYIAQQYAKADANLEMVEKTIDGVKKYYPVVVGATRDGVSYVAKSFISDWYRFLDSIDFFSGMSLPEGVEGAYIPSVVSVENGKYAFSGTVTGTDSNGSFEFVGDGIYYNSKPALKWYRGYGGHASAISYMNSQISHYPSRAYSVNTGGLPLFIITDDASFNAANNYINGTGDLSLASNVGDQSVASQYSFGLTDNLPVAGADDVFFPKTWVGEKVDDLPFDGTTKEGLTVGAGDIPDAIPIDLGSDIPSLWDVGADVPSDVIANPTDIPATGELPWELPTTGDLPFPIPGVAFPGSIPAEDTWPSIQDKAQSGVYDGSIDVPIPGVSDAWPSVDNAPTDAQVEAAADGALDWAIGSVLLPDGLFDKVPFCIPYDCYLLATSVLSSSSSEGGQIDPSGVAVVSDGVAADFGSAALSWRSAPHIQGVIHLPLGKGIDIPIDIDCSEYDYFAALVWYGTAFIWTALILVSISRSFGRM